jgi:Protein of unknown function (DUF2946)
VDESVKQAMAKWPSVPHCYGWLALDARGRWRMRDAQAQALGLPGDKIGHAALLGFINRNYLHDDRGRWYFQNGPQRVYVNLEATPYIARTDPAHGFVFHTGQPLSIVDAAWMTESGRLLLQGDGKIALVDDRDMAQCMTDLRIDDAGVSDHQLLAWLNRTGMTGQLSLVQSCRHVSVRHIADDAIATHFGFVQAPRPDEEC